MAPRPILLAVVLALACRSAPAPPAARGVLLVAGRAVPVDLTVVGPTDPGGYDATSTDARFRQRAAGPAPGSLRYTPGRGALAPTNFEGLLERIDQLVLHYDACGSSRRCFEVLHDLRGLSVHFLLDVDGTLYQTLDLAHKAWHARQANERSIGIEIANIGAWTPGDGETLARWYARDAQGLRLVLPAEEQASLRTTDFVGHAARPEVVGGVVQGTALEMVDLTPEQYATLVALTAELCRLFPRLAPEAPRDVDGSVARGVLEDDEFGAFQGVLGHLHVSSDKLDPGPAFDWEGYLEAVRERLARPRP